MSPEYVERRRTMETKQMGVLEARSVGGKLQYPEMLTSPFRAGWAAHYAFRSVSRLRIRVTRNTSSIVVTPAITFRAPSLRRFVIPRFIASSWI
jgi:hypothetical protein